MSVVASALAGNRAAAEELAEVVIKVLDDACARDRFPCLVATSSGLSVLAYPPLTQLYSLILSPDDDHKTQWPDVIRKYHPDVIRASVRLLSRAASSGWTFTTTPCDCEDNCAILADLHQDFGLERQNTPTRAPVLSPTVDVLDVILNCLDSACLDVFHFGAMRWVGTHPRPWPRSKDLAEAICVADIGIYYQSGMLVSLLASLLSVLPFPQRLLRVTALIIPKVVVPFISAVIRRWDESPRNARNPEELRNSLLHCAQLFGIISNATEELLRSALECAGVDYQSLLRAFVRPLVISAAAGETAEESEAHTALLTLVVRIHRALDLPDEPDVYWITHQSIDRLYDRKFGLVAQQLMGLEELLRSNASCACPGCDSDYLMQERGLAACKGCLHVFYCSRACQKRAWKYPTSPHKTFCADLREIVHESLAVPRGWTPQVPRCRAATETELGDYQAVCAQQEDRVVKLIAHLNVCHKPSAHQGGEIVGSSA